FGYVLLDNHRNSADVATWRCDVLRSSRIARDDRFRTGSRWRRPTGTPPSRPAGTHVSRVPMTCLALRGGECKETGLGARPDDGGPGRTSADVLAGSRSTGGAARFGAARRGSARFGAARFGAARF